MNQAVQTLIDQRLKVLQIIILAAIMSLVAYVGISIMLIRQGAVEPLNMPPIVLPILCAYSLSTLFTAPLIVKGMVAKARRLSTPADRLGPYQTAMIVGVTLRESIGVIGLVLTLLTSSLLWVCLFSALAAFAILTNLPTRSALDNLIRDVPPIV